MEKNKEDGMTDLEIIKERCEELSEMYPDCWGDGNIDTGNILDAATRMAAEIERLKAEIIEANEKAKDQGRTACNLFDELKKLQKENRELETALAEKPDIVRCGECSNLVINDNAKYCGICLDAKRKRNDFCSRGTRKEAKDED